MDRVSPNPYETPAHPAGAAPLSQWLVGGLFSVALLAVIGGTVAGNGFCFIALFSSPFWLPLWGLALPYRMVTTYGIISAAVPLLAILFVLLMRLGWATGVLTFQDTSLILLLLYDLSFGAMLIFAFLFVGFLLAALIAYARHKETKPRDKLARS